MNQLKPIFRLVLITIFAASGLIGCVGDDSGTETVAVTVRSEGVPLGTSTQPDSDSLRIPIDGSGGTSGDGDTGSDGSHAEGAENGTENGTENTETGAGEIVPDPLSLAGGRMNWRLDRDEQYTFNVEGGVEPYSWSVVGQVDPRLDIRLQDGVLHAHPRVAGKFDVKVRVTDHHNSSQEKEFRIKVAEGFTLSAKLCKATRDAAGKITACSEEGATLANPAPNVVLDKDHVLKLEVDGHAERYQWTVNHQDLEIVSRATSSGRTTSKTRDRENRRMRFLQLKGEFRNVTLPTVTVTAKDDGDNRDLWTATDVVAQERVNTLESMRAYFSNDDGENKVKLNDAHYDSLMVRGGTPPYSIKEVRSTLLRSGGFCELYEVAEGKSYVTKANTWELTPKNEHEFALNGAFKYTVPITVDSFTHYCDHVTEVLMVSVQDQTGKVDTATKSFSIQYPTDRESGFEGTIKFQARDLLLNLTEIAVELLDQQGTVKYRSEALPLYPYSGDAGNCHFNEDEGDGYCINEVPLKFYNFGESSKNITDIKSARILFYFNGTDTDFRFYGLSLKGSFWEGKMTMWPSEVFSSEDSGASMLMPTKQISWKPLLTPRAYNPSGNPSSWDVNDIICSRNEEEEYECTCGGTKQDYHSNITPHARECVGVIAAASAR